MSNSTRIWVNGFRNGDDDAIGDFWATYQQRLVRIAEQHMADRLRRRVEADDVVQSVFRTFIRRARDGQFEFDNRDELLSLLATITLNKIRQQVRYHMRKKRGMDQEEYLDSLAEITRPEPTPDEQAALSELEEHIRTMSEEEQQLIALRLENHTQREIAGIMGCSERTVRRLFQRIQKQLQMMADQALE